MKDWRPIALCTVIYKVVAKVLANRLKVVLEKCISDTQSAFVLGRSILDNAMAAIEIIHHTKSKVKGKVGEVALKLDIMVRRMTELSGTTCERLWKRWGSHISGSSGLCCA